MHTEPWGLNKMPQVRFLTTKLAANELAVWLWPLRSSWSHDFLFLQKKNSLRGVKIKLNLEGHSAALSLHNPRLSNQSDSPHRCLAHTSPSNLYFAFQHKGFSEQLPVMTGPAGKQEGTAKHNNPWEPGKRSRPTTPSPHPTSCPLLSFRRGGDAQNIPSNLKMSFANSVSAAKRGNGDCIVI